MKVTAPDDKKYVVKFKHDCLKGTTCFIWLADVDGKSLKEINPVIGKSFLSVKDLNKYCKKTGRKIALTDALDLLYPHSEVYEKSKKNKLVPVVLGEISTRSNKTCRKAFWEQYLKECKY